MQASPRIDELRQKFHENPRRYFAPLANEYRKAGDPEQAIAICRAHLAQQPAHMSGHVVYGQALYDARRPDEARAVFEKALSLDPDNAIVLRQLGDIAREKGDAAEARHWYSKAIDIDPNDTVVAAYIAELTDPISGETASDDATSAEPAVIQATHESPQPGEIAAHASEAEPRREAEPQPEAGPEREAQPETEEERDPEAAPEAFDEGIEAGQQPEREPDAAREALDEGIEAGQQAELEPAAELEALDEGIEAGQQAELEPAAELEPIDETVEAAEPESIADTVVEEAEEAVAAATPAEPQGDGADPERPDGEGAEVATEAPHSAGGEDAEDIEAAGEVDWRKTPRPVESPFITRTMAELYARQGYTAAALDVYRQLALRNPEDEELRQRIAELSGEGEKDRVAASDAVPADEAVAPQPQEAEPTTDAPSLEPIPEPFAELSDEPVFPPSSEDLNLATVDAKDDSGGLHFTEIDLSDRVSTEGIQLDESPFGELYWGEEVVEAQAAEQPAPDTKSEAASEAAIPGEARFVDVPVALREFQTSIDEAGVAATSPHADDFPPAAAVEPADLAQAEVAAAEDEAAEAMDTPPEEMAESTIAGREESAVVAYSPEPPRDEDLPHFKPRGQTIREFFATLGAHRPGARESFTARAAIPKTPPRNETVEDLPLATDAFSTLFPDAAVNEDDTRAAFALSGALSGTAHNPAPSSVRTSPPKPVPPVIEPPEPTKESEDDIRRFREWLDGLADS